jgi:D-alanine-D-alanine ligase
MKLRVGIIFGGKSGEHEVSLQSAKNIYDALDRDRFEPVLIGVDKEGIWHLGRDASFILNASNPKLIALNTREPAVVPVESPGRPPVLKDPENGSVQGSIDVFFPVIHGTFGEDGSLQGFLRLLDAPYVGAGVLGSAVGMDKDVMKRLMKDAGLPVPAFQVVRRRDREAWNAAQAVRELDLPLFVKPCNLGSSVGISKVHTEKELKPAVEAAFSYDTKVILEEAVRGREIECAVLGNDSPKASLCGEVIPTGHEFYSYDSKYVDEHGAILKSPADLDPATMDRIRSLAVRVFQVMECEGMARVDFFLEPGGRIVVNEINTLPGFTRISMYPRLWEASGLPYRDLLTRLVQLAVERHDRESGLKRHMEFS